MGIEIPQWPLPPSVRALTTTRRAGRSPAPFDSFNTALHVGDSPQNVEHNRAELLKATGHPIQWLNQVHGTEVVEIDNVNEQVLTADASITSQPEIVCAVQTADCLPILLCDRRAIQVAAVHAGWRGLAAGIISATIAKFSAPATDLSAWLGPAISQGHFEVGAEVYRAFGDWADNIGITRDLLEAAFLKTDGKYLADLYVLARLELKHSGVSEIWGGAACTWRDADRYYSYRRDGKTGRMTTAIWIER